MTDLRFAIRQLQRSPGFAAVAVLTLALGIGVNTTVFSITNGLLLRPLPVPEPERLVALFTTYQKQSGLNGTSYPDYRDLRDRSDVFEGLAGHFYFPMAVRTADQAEVVLGHVVSWNYLEVLGVSPAVGRAFLPEEDQAPGARPVAMLSHRYWQTRLLGDRGVIGRTVSVNSRSFTVVGVAPEGFTSLCTAAAPDVWVPVAMIGQVLPYPINLEGRFDPWLDEAPQPYLCEALAQGDFVKRFHLHLRTAAAPQDWIHPVLNAIHELDPNLPPPRALTLRQFLEASVEAVAGPVRIVGLFGLLALTMAVVGVYGVLAFVVSQRRHEFGVRLALGASARGLLGLVLRQGLWLTGVGAVMGLVGALLLSHLLASLLYEVSPWDPLTFVVATAALITAGAVASYGPAHRAATLDPVVALRCE
ncbi:MAG: ABC transporter permease [Verrucomicrobiales bacterium]|nr:ABC transporter permease [Verrucomicrobiales bacterium]